MDGTRVEKEYAEYDGNGNPNGTLTTYYFAGGAYEVQTGGAETVSKIYYSIAGQTVAVRMMTSGSSTLNYLLTDHLGSVVGVTDEDGALLSEQRYLPFGQVRPDVGSVTETDFGYSGQRDLDAQQNVYSLGLMDYKARFYDVSLNRFTQPDTITPYEDGPQGLNIYSYVLNNPFKYNDPSGHQVLVIGGTAAVAGIAILAGIILAINYLAHNTTPAIDIHVNAIEKAQNSWETYASIDREGLEYFAKQGKNRVEDIVNRIYSGLQGSNGIWNRCKTSTQMSVFCIVGVVFAISASAVLLTNAGCDEPDNPSTCPINDELPTTTSTPTIPSTPSPTIPIQPVPTPLPNTQPIKTHHII